jgi:hypothetical protein
MNDGMTPLLTLGRSRRPRSGNEFCIQGGSHGYCPGNALPQAKFKTVTATGPSRSPRDELLKGKKAVLFAVPGAFTPTCHVKHLPGFV